MTTDEIEEIRRLSSSKSMMGLAEAVRAIDTKTLVDSLSVYLYLSSKRVSGEDILKFMLAKRPMTLTTLALELMPAVGRGFLTDGAFRSLVTGTLLSLVLRSPLVSEGVTESKTGRN